MTPDEAATVLATAAAFDNRTPSKIAPAAWAEALADIDVKDAQVAVSRHYSTSDDYLKPVHIRRIVEDIVRERRREIRERKEQLALNAERATYALGRDRSADIAALIAEVRTGLPDTGPDVMRQRTAIELDRRRRQRNTTTNAAPNPLYDPTALERLRDMDPGA